jgi:hypothetical protein
MTAQTSQQKSQAFRQRRKDDGMQEVRNLWAPKSMHATVKKLFKEWLKKQ